MINKVFQVFLVVFLTGCSPAPDIREILKTTYEDKMISSGNNRPQISLGKDNLREMIILLHQRIPPGQIQTYYGWDDEELGRRLNLLAENDFVQQIGPDTYVPTSMVIDRREGEKLAQSAKVAAKPMAEYLANQVTDIQRQVSSIPGFRDIPFEKVSFLVMSDVILDNWQINNIERLFIGSERTPRHGMNYYHSLQESDPERGTEAFGIYGNQMWSNGPFMAAVYGNKRSTSKSILNLKKQDYMELFGMPESASVSDFRASMVRELVRFSQDPKQPVDPTLIKGLSHLGILDGSSLAIPVLQKSDYDSLSALAARYAHEIAAILLDNKEALREDYKNSRYAEEISFGEYLIWWYHFLYSEVTDELAREGVISIPSSGIVTYLVDWSD